MTGKRITYDAAPGLKPRAGDVLCTRTGRLWLILSSRRVRSRVSESRWALRAVRVDDDVASGRRFFPLCWYPRGQRRRHTGIVPASQRAR